MVAARNSVEQFIMWWGVLLWKRDKIVLNPHLLAVPMKSLIRWLCDANEHGKQFWFSVINCYRRSAEWKYPEKLVTPGIKMFQRVLRMADSEHSGKKSTGCRYDVSWRYAEWCFSVQIAKRCDWRCNLHMQCGKSVYRKFEQTGMRPQKK